MSESQINYTLVGGADNMEVRMDGGSLIGGGGKLFFSIFPSNGRVNAGPGIGTDATSGELSGVLSKSFGDNESKLSMPLSCSIDIYAAKIDKNKYNYF